MIKKKLLLYTLLAGGLALNAQYIGNKLDIGIGPIFSTPLNSSTIRQYNEFYYPSLFGNYTAGMGISAVLDYHISSNLRIGAEFDYTAYGKWKGDQEKFLLSQPVVSMSTVSINTVFFPERFQPETSSLKWALSASPLLSYHILEWQEKMEIPGRHSTLSGGIKTGVCLFYEINNMNILRMDVFYQLEKLDNIYYLDRYYHSLNIAFYLSFKLFKNRHFWYD